jgi:MerR family redox-sensitive transcriptional activator SoxR
MTLPGEITIGELAARSGLATSALRYYEERGLISSHRTSGNQRRYPRATLRRVSVVQAAQQLGLSLDEIGAALDALPDRRTPNRKDWERLSKRWRHQLDERIAALELLRGRLDGCIGCGCLSLDTCALFNAGDALAARGPGPRILLGDAGIGPGSADVEG